MRRSSSIFRRTFVGTVIACMAWMLCGVVTVAFAQTPQTTFVLRPHCEHTEASNQGIFGEIPAPYPLIRLGTGNCYPFETEDPQTLKTSLMKAGDILDFDVVIRNNGKDAIQHARAWLTYDPTVLQGLDITIDSAFPTITPGERDFDATKGFVMIDASAVSGKEPTTDPTPLARVRFKILATPAGGTPIAFHDIQPSGHTYVLRKSSTNPQGESALGVNPSALHVRFLLANGSACTSHLECESLQCVNGICSSGSGSTVSAASSLSSMQSSARCTVDAECFSGQCTNGICQATNGSGSSSLGGTSAFSLLQVRNLRVTTQGTSAFLAWDPLQSSQLKAYNVYYGTTSGRYIQRKTIDASQRSLTLLDLPGGVMYYFAIRAVSTADEESAFSQEVAVTISDPSSSTSPLVLRVGEAEEQTTTSPVQSEGNIAGETGVSSTLILLLATSAIIGTAFAARRQFSARAAPPLP
ncbi:MAG: fibronectin type III domain-containing protein [Candidatus Peregrinibacteria bacterium]